MSRPKRKGNIDRTVPVLEKITRGGIYVKFPPHWATWVFSNMKRRVNSASQDDYRIHSSHDYSTPSTNNDLAFNATVMSNF